MAAFVRSSPRITINQPGTREAQEVRNHLIFLFAGGAGEPASPAYSMQLSVVPQYLSLMLVQNATNDKSGQPTAGLMRMTGNYVVDAHFRWTGRRKGKHGS